MSSPNILPRVSIVTVVYNSERTLEQTVSSVLAQTYHNIEYVIVDGGSTDGSVAIIEKYSDKIAKWISEPDKGISDAFNKGIALTSGDLIGILNADDWFTPEAVETIVKSIQPGYDVYCANLKLVGEDGYTQERRSRVSLLNYGMYIMHPTVFVSGNVYKTIGGFDTNLKIAMDYDMMLRIKKNSFKFKHIDATIAFMRTDGASSDVKKMHKEELVVMKRHLKGVDYLKSLTFNFLNRLRWKFFYKSPFNIK